MKKIITLLLVFSSVCLFAQTKEQAFAEMNEISKKSENKTLSVMDDGKTIIVSKQLVYPEFVFEVTTGDVVIVTTGEKIKWDSYKESVKEDDKSGLVIYTVVFKKKFKIIMNTGLEILKGPYDQLSVYIDKADVLRFEELLQIVSKKE